jgi:hypothetical protein
MTVGSPRQQSQTGKSPQKPSKPFGMAVRQGRQPSERGFYHDATVSFTWRDGENEAFQILDGLLLARAASAI